MIINNDSLHALKELEADSIDAVITDPPYGYSFMGKDWDKAVPSVEIWQECLRVLKPGGWCMVMSAPRSDVQNAMISRLMEAGFRLDFTPIYWTYASGFPKAGNVGKLVDKRLGAEREVVEAKKFGGRSSDAVTSGASNGGEQGGYNLKDERSITRPATDQAKALDGSYTGFQPKPAVEVIIVAMKPLSEKTYVDQALKNSKGITWLDDCRVPTGDLAGRVSKGGNANKSNSMNELGEVTYVANEQGRFPANLLVSDEALNTHSKFFDLDAWAKEKLTLSPELEALNQQEGTFEPIISTLPFIATPKASKSEKNKGLEHFEDKNAMRVNAPRENEDAKHSTLTKNVHPTVKPLKLMSYLITLTTREGDTVLDPFVGSGTTVVAAKQLGRKGVGIEREKEYAEISRARVAATDTDVEQLTIV